VLPVLKFRRICITTRRLVTSRRRKSFISWKRKPTSILAGLRSRTAAGPNGLSAYAGGGGMGRARKHFRFPRKSGGGYQFVTMANYDELLDSARLIEPAKREKIERIIDLFVQWICKRPNCSPLCTPPGTTCCSKAIHRQRRYCGVQLVKIGMKRRARFPRHKFFEALRLLRDKDCKPAGRGRKVESSPQGSLFA